MQPGTYDAIGAAASWLTGLATGSAATSIAVLAVAGLGFAMLRGRLELWHAGRVIIGCALLFSAVSLAHALYALSGQTGQNAPPAAPDAAPSPVPKFTPPPAYDPYAGASVPN